MAQVFCRPPLSNGDPKISLIEEVNGTNTCSVFGFMTDKRMKVRGNSGGYVSPLDLYYIRIHMANTTDRQGNAELTKSMLGDGADIDPCCFFLIL